ncbi:putative MFS transporter [Pseudomassariella vexata]|uniref:Putative MFS transporter n=1 Tax=Pseudomassariella vexata TaxID=1141098 RepID=A0A1Y2EBV8_9PEZI|nr:putative MFS transporter [Pseudomassariella vexata]ORY69063.1 putative MFS transporter [Pseudomassariella vexata]
METGSAATHQPEHSRHLVHSHAHEGAIPGTVDLRAAEGDDTAYGQALYPVPAEDPNDPLQWVPFKKSMILVICCTYSFIGNSALLGPAPYITLFSQQFGVTPSRASGLISYPNLAFGFGSLFLVPMYPKFGRRPVMLGSMLLFIAGLIGASQAHDYRGLMIARVFHAFGAGICEAIPVQLVNDIFFLHERGKRIGYYTFALCLGTIAPLPAAHMLIEPYSWRLFFYIILAFALALFVLALLFVEETSYDRKTHVAANPSLPDEGSGSVRNEKPITELQEQTTPSEPSVPPRKSFLETLRPWGRVDHSVPFFMTMARSFTYLLVPQVFWVITSFGIYIGLGAFAFNFTFPIKITAPPYNWTEENSGLIALSSLIGFLLAVPFTSTSDRLATYFTRRKNGIREAEMRLGVMLPAAIIAPAGLILYGLTAELNLHWMGFFAGSAITSWGAYFYFSFALAYAVDSYQANTSEMLIAMNLGKQAISFGLSLDLLNWVLERGYAVVIAGIFGSVLVVNNVFVIVFMVFGKRIRKLMVGTWLAKLHGPTGDREPQVA